ncbi:hypothetical protein [Aeromonas veronii]|uniref:GTP pyrophosphokinase n=1 Tax=Aeromonas veronii TaxID=654 RepID=UPI0029DB381F|nr:hypothetical protein [Aeromonas veronii]MDX7874579.1 hypothetical protein [Aeromonas veronii]
MTDLAQLFREVKPKYERLGNNVKQALVQFLDEKKISSFDVENRVKDEQSFIDKVERKSYNNPLEQVEDIAGVRVICYYNEDLSSIDEIIHEQFVVLSYSNKSNELSDNQFGYASNHYVIRLKEEWLQAPNYRGLEGLKVEIQVRTILMHSWAAISHKLLYKKNDDVPKEFKRKLNRLSALIELADEQFDDIKNMKLQYQSQIIVNETTSLNIDSFLALMNKYFPNREIAENDISSILSEVREYSGSLADFEQRINRCLPIINSMEQDEYPGEKIPRWGLNGVARSILDLTSDEYWAQRGLPEPVSSITEHYRNKI